VNSLLLIIYGGLTVLLLIEVWRGLSRRNIRPAARQGIWYKLVVTLFFDVVFFVALTEHFYQTVDRGSWHLGVPNVAVIIAIFIGLLSSCIFFALSPTWERDAKNRRISAIGVFIISCMVVPSLIRTFNGMWSKGKPQSHIAQVLRKKMSSSKGSTSYYLYVPDWSRKTGDFGVSVSSSIYNTKSEGSIIKIVTDTGFLGWDVITDVS